MFKRLIALVLVTFLLIGCKKDRTLEIVQPLELLTPANNTTQVNNNDPSALSWSTVEWSCANNLDLISYDLYFGETSNPSLFQHIKAGLNSPTSLITKPNTTYYWRVVAKSDNNILSESPTWSFTTSNIAGGNIGETIKVEGGIYLMGSLTGFDDEKPVHEVTLSSFNIGKFEVTNIEFAEFLNAKGNQYEGGGYWYEPTKPYNSILELVNGVYTPAIGKENYPVFYVSWYGAKAYSQWVGGRLPTEAEWEFAAKGGSNNDSFIYSGSNNIDEVAWYLDNYQSYLNNNQTPPGELTVGTKLPNQLGLYGMTGGAWEWCSDYFSAYDSLPQVNPTGPITGNKRILRGGSISYYDYNCTVTRRKYRNPNYNDYTIGFRVVLP